MPTYGTLQTELQNELDHSELNTLVPTWINDAIREIETRDYWSQDLREATGTWTAGARSVSLVSDFRDEERVFTKLSTENRWKELDIWSLDEARRQYTDANTGRPEVLVLTGSTYALYPLPDVAYDYSFWYYAWLPTLSGTNETNWITDRYPEAIKQWVLWKGFGYIFDEGRSNRALQLFEQKLRLMKRQERRRRWNNRAVLPAFPDGRAGIGTVRDRGRLSRIAGQRIT